MSSLRCKVGVHDWNRFGEMVTAYGGLTQFRSCKRCNLIGFVKCYGNQAKPVDVNRTAGDVSSEASSEASKPQDLTLGQYHRGAV